ncbi:MAG TPA: hypothetical protein VK680_03790 [Solirubrobacteraceae bacterium]|jgi:hypothetical protein|nr:hypothetical protein [Solirubrobacteraceae bacterium]
MSILPQLEHDLCAAAERRLAPTPASRPTPTASGSWRSRRRIVLSLAIAAVALMGAGGGALLFAPGKPLPPAYELPPMSTAGLGRPLAPSLAVLGLRVADPAGGPAWGMRVIRTTRGLACIQAGRVVDGQLGGLGIGYAFKGDRRFHPFAPADAVSEDSCATLAANGLAFQPGAPAIVTADGLPLAGENLWPYERVHCDLPGQEDWGVRCPQADLREVAVGMLGPDAASVRVSVSGRQFTVKPYGPDGVYLIVLPAPPNSNTSSGLYAYVHHLLVRRPALAVLSVIYKDGSSCRIPAQTQRQTCTPKGLVISTAVPSAAKMRATLHVNYRASLPYSPPLSVTGPGGRTFHSSLHPSEKPGPGLMIDFTAPAPAPNISSGYDVELQPQARAGCSTPALILSQPTQQTLAAGQRVQIAVSTPSSCRTTYHGRVFFVGSSGSYSEARTSEHSGEGPLYEVIAGLFTGARRSSAPGVTVGRFDVSIPADA